MPGLFIDIEARFAQFQRSLDQIAGNSTRAVGQINTAFTAVKGLASAFVVRELYQFTAGLVNFADELHTMHERTNIAHDDLAGLRFLAEQTGAQFEDMTSAVFRLKRAMSEALSNPGGKQARLFADLGLLDAIKQGESALQIFTRFADVFQRLSDEDQTRATMQLMGRASTALIPALRGGSAAVQGYLDKSRELQPHVKAAAIASDVFKDRVNELGTGIRGNLLPPLTLVLEKMIEIDRVQRATARSTGKSSTFWEGLMNFMSMPNTDDPLKAIDKLENRIRAFEDYQKSLSKDKVTKFFAQLLTPEDITNNNIQINRARQQIAVLRELLKEKVSLNAAGLVQDPSGEFLKAPAEARIPLTDEDNEQQRLRALDNALKRLERDLGREREMFSARNEFLDAAYRDDLVSIERYTAQKESILEVSFGNQDAILRRQLDALRAAKKEAAKPIDQIALQGRIDEVQDRLSDIPRQRELERERQMLRNTQATRAYDERLKEVSATLQDLEGNTRAAAEIRFDVRHTQLRNRLEAEGNTIMVERLKRLRELTVGVAGLADMEQRANSLRQNLFLTEQRIMNAQQTGAITEFEALQRIGQERARTVEQLRTIVDEYETMALTLRDTKMIDNARQLRIELENLATQADILGDKFRTMFSTAGSGTLVEFMEGEIRSVEQLLDSFLGDLGRQINRVVADEISKSLFSKDGIFGAGPEFFKKLFGFDQIEQAITAVGSGMDFGGPGVGFEAASDAAEVLSESFIETESEVLTAAITFGTVEAAALPLAPAFIELTAAVHLASIALEQMASRDAAEVFASGLDFGGAGVGFHGGGIAALRASFIRYHGGGIAGEVPAILRAGEGVFTPEQMEHLAPIDEVQGQEVHVTNNFHVATPTDQRTQAQIARMAGQSLARAVRRDG